MLDINEVFLLSFKALWANKLRSMLTMLGIIIGVAAVILLVSIGSGLQAYITQAFEGLGSNLLIIVPGKIKMRDSREGGPPGAATNKLTENHVKVLARKMKSADKALPVAVMSTTAKYAEESIETSVIGTWDTYSEVRNSPVSVGRFFDKSENDRGRKVAVLGTTVVENLFGDINPIGKKISISDQKYTVTGVTESKGAGLGNDQDDQIIIPLKAMQRQFDLDKVTYIYVKAKNANAVEPAREEITNILLKQNLDEDEFSILDQKEILSTVSSILNIITAGLGGIAAISLIVGGIGIMNIMLVSVTERTREIGLRKALGATRGDIMWQFVIEAVFLSLVGGLIGIVIGWGGSLLLSRFLTSAVTLWSVLVAFFVSAIIGIIFGVAPAAKAANLDPIVALRFE